MDTQNRRTLERLTGKISQSQHLLAAITPLARGRALAKNLANLSG
jgi:hypothetical protein